MDVKQEICRIKVQFTDLLNHYANNGGGWDEIYILNEKICHKMVDLDPERFIDRTMSGPCSMVTYPNIEGLDPEEYDFLTIQATSSLYEFRCKPHDLYHINMIAEKLLEELVEKDQFLIKKRHRWLWNDVHTRHLKASDLSRLSEQVPMNMVYFPAYIVRAIDPADYSPTIGFNYRGGITWGNSRIYRLHEDRLLEDAKNQAIAKKMGWI